MLRKDLKIKKDLLYYSFLIKQARTKTSKLIMKIETQDASIITTGWLSHLQLAYIISRSKMRISFNGELRVFHGTTCK